MSTRIADLRSELITIENARAHFNDLARRIIAMRAADATHEKRIAEHKARHDNATAPDRQKIAEMEESLSAYINDHRELFKSPRKIKTTLGTFGLQKVSELVITNEDTLRSDLLEKGYDDCIETVYKLQKPAIKTRVESGEKLPGCHVKTGDTAVYKVPKTIQEPPDDQTATD